MASKCFLSNPIHIKDFLNPSYTTIEDLIIEFLPIYQDYKIILCYVKYKGYTLIKKVNNTYWFKCFEVSEDPEYFYKNYDKEIFKPIIDFITNDYLQDYQTFLKNELKLNPFEIEKKIKDITEDIIDTLTSTLEDKYNNNITEKVSNYNSNDIKAFLSNPIESFDFYLKKEKDIKDYTLTTKEIIEKKENIKGLASDLIKEVNKLSSYVSEDNKPVLSNYDFNNIISNLINETVSSTNYKDYFQNNRGIFKRTKSGFQLIARFNIIEALKILDPLNISEPIYNLKIDNFTNKRIETFKNLNSFELVEEIKKAKIFYNNNDIEKFMNTYFIEGCISEDIQVKESIYKQGFYLVNGKVIENTNIKELNYTPEDVKDAINLLNDIISSRSLEGRINDSSVYRFMLYAPFSYCLKQIGFKMAIYSLILIGKSKSNKTGSYNIGNLFYLNNEKENTASTISTISSLLDNNTFSKAIDECYNLIKNNPLEMADLMKKAIDNYTTRITRDNKNLNTNNNLVYNALGLPVFILNERLEFKDYITERYKIIDYTIDSFIDYDTREAFNEIYTPEKPETILKKLAFIGCEYKKRMIKLIEKSDTILFNPEQATINILKDIAYTTGLKTNTPDLNFINELYELTETSNNYNYDVKQEIRNIFNNDFKKKNKINFNKSIDAMTFINSITRNDFNFIIWNKYRTAKTQHKEFIIISSELVKYVNKQLTGLTVNLKEIIEALELTDILKEKAINENKNFDTFIKSQHIIKTKINPKKKDDYINKSGFYLDLNELSYNLFGIDIDLTENINYESEEIIISGS